MTRAEAELVMRRCDALATCSESPDGIYRPVASPALRQAQQMLRGWMEEAGLEVVQDNVGNLRGRLPRRERPATLVLGSHLDSVPNAGKYDGPLGILVALVAVERLADALPYTLELVAFADEEGSRFGTSYLGSSVLAGTFDSCELDRTDSEGVTLRAAIRDAGGDPDSLAADAWREPELLGYCEVHIEQGPVLEASGAAVGVVSGIAGQSQRSYRLAGRAGHAGTVPMDHREDALAAAAEFVLLAESEGRATAGLVATVGKLVVRQGAANVIPGEVDLTLDVRHLDDAVRRQAGDRLAQRGAEMAATRSVGFRLTNEAERPSVHCSPRLMDLLSRAVAECGHEVRLLPSGAGHDAVVMSGITEVGMLFVRCRGGVSHHPNEAVTVADVGVAIDVLEKFLTMVPAGVA